MKKLAVIRGEGIARCPYGLPVTEACKSVGDSILQMTAIGQVEKEDRPKTAKKNRVIYLTQKTEEKCPFADQIFEQYDKVNCSWGDVAAGEHSGYLSPSPFYPNLMIGNGLAPGRTDNQQNITDPRQTYFGQEKGVDVPFGLYSIFSSKDNEAALIKLAESTNKSASIEGKIASLKQKYFETLGLIFPNGFIVKLNNEHLGQLLLVIDDWTK